MLPGEASACVSVLAFAAMVGGDAALAQDFPTKAITIVLVLAPGTGLDAVARAYGEKLAQRLGKPVVFDNRPGANGIVAVSALKNMPGDGHALLVGTSGPLAANKFTYKHLPYDPEKDLVPVSLYLKSPFVLIVNPALPVKSVPELIKFMKGRPGELSYSSTGHGGAPRLATEMFLQSFGLNATHVPYKNSPQSIADVAAGHVELAFSEAGATQVLIQEGRLRALAVSSLARLGHLPNVPTMAEATGYADFEAVSWHALVAPSTTPVPVVNKLHVEMNRALRMPDVRERIVSQGMIPVEPGTVEENRRYIAAEAKKWGDLITKLGLAGSQ